MPNVKQWLSLSPLSQRWNKPVSLSWSLSAVSAIPNVKQWLSLSPLGQRRKERLFPRLIFGPIETVFIPVNRHVTWKFPFSSGVPIGYCLHDSLVIGWFKCFQNLKENLGAGVSPDRDPTSCDFTCVLWLVLWLCWRFNDVVFGISWLNNEFWLAGILMG